MTREIWAMTWYTRDMTPSYVSGMICSLTVRDMTPENINETWLERYEPWLEKHGTWLMSNIRRTVFYGRRDSFMCMRHDSYVHTYMCTEHIHPPLVTHTNGSWGIRGKLCSTVDLTLWCVWCVTWLDVTHRVSLKRSFPLENISFGVRGPREHCRFDSLMCVTWLDMTHRVSLKRSVALENMSGVRGTSSWNEGAPYSTLDLTLWCVWHD